MSQVASAPLETASRSQTGAGIVRRPLVRAIGVALLALLVAGYLSVSLEVLDSRVRWQLQVTEHPFVISDLYPRWAGARAMLAGRDPYSAAVTAELQRAYYGRPMPAEVEREVFGTIVEFFYPPYVVLPLLPLLWLPFETARWLATGLLALAVAASALLWWRHCGGAGRRQALGAVAAGSLLFYPSLDLITLQQLTGLVLLQLVGAFTLAARGRYAWAGALLALATVKPQSAAIPAAALLFWSLWRRERWRLPLAFGGVMAGQLALSEVLAPGWVGGFLAAGARYREFNRIGYWLPEFVLGSQTAGALLIAAPAALALVWLWWRCRRGRLDTPLAVLTIGATFGAVVVLLPDISFYNKSVLLLPLLALAAIVPDGTLHQRLARAGVALWVVAPAVAMGVAGWCRWYELVTGDRALLGLASALVSAFRATHTALPLVVVPVLLSLALRVPEDTAGASEAISPGVGSGPG